MKSLVKFLSSDFDLKQVLMDNNNRHTFYYKFDLL